jgi:hypothetical protein
MCRDLDAALGALPALERHVRKAGGVAAVVGRRLAAGWLPIAGAAAGEVAKKAAQLISDLHVDDMTKLPPWISFSAHWQGSLGFVI